MHKIIPFLALGMLLVGTTLVMAQNESFTDVSAVHPHAAAIAYVKSQGIVEGYSDGSFRPDNAVNRVELLKILQEAEYPDLPECRAAYAYQDVNWSDWYGAYLQIASCQGIVSGYPDGTFKPGNPVKVTEGVKIISEAYDHEVEAADSIWYYPYLDNLGDRKVIPRTINSVEDNLTRGQMAEMIYRLRVGNTGQSYHNRATLIAAQAAAEGSLDRIYETDGSAWVEITTDENYRYIKGNGLPNHETGSFPNSGNPNSISAQEVSYRVPLNPVLGSTSQWVREPGVAINGVKFEPETAERYQNTDWKYEAIQAGVRALGLDENNAHVQPTGAYHYHSVPMGLVEKLAAGNQADTLLLGYAADGVGMYYSQAGVYEPSFRLKSGTRPDGPGGSYDGTFTQDFEFIEGLGDLDECNGKWVNGVYRYYLTDRFPYMPRCLRGEVDSSFGAGGGQRVGSGTGASRGGQRGGEIDLTEAALKLGVSVSELQSALGTPPPDLAQAALILGVSEADLKSVMPRPNR